jgi:hypothetical protein
MRLLKALLLLAALFALGSAYQLKPAGAAAPACAASATPVSAVAEVALLDSALDSPFVEEDSTLTAARGCKGCYG